MFSGVVTWNERYFHVNTTGADLVNEKQIVSGEIVPLLSLAMQEQTAGARALVKDEAFHALLLQVKPARPVAEHAVDGPIVVQCLRGTVDFSIEGVVREMKPGDWMFVAGGKPHALSAAEDATLLVLRILSS